MINIIHHSAVISNTLDKNGFNFFTPCVKRNLIRCIQAFFSKSFNGKTVDMARSSNIHRTTAAHFLNKGKWDDALLQDAIKATVIENIYEHSKRTGKPIYCIIDDTISSKTKPSSQAVHPMEAAFFHQSHLKRRQDYGHQAVVVMLACDNIILNYATCMYDKSQSKIEMITKIADELPIPPCGGYLLCDSWYTAKNLIEAFAVHGFHTIGAIKTNRVIYPCGIHQQVKDFAALLSKDDSNIKLLKIGNRKYYVYRYDGDVNGIHGITVIISYPENAFGNPKALRVFLSTDSNLSTEEILNTYTHRWPIEVFFRETKGTLSMDKYQIRSATGIKRYWLIISLVYLLCCIGTDKITSFNEGYKFYCEKICIEKIEFIKMANNNGMTMESLAAMVA